MKGSAISPTVTNGIPAGVLAQRNDLIQKGIIKDGVFSEDFEFSSPSSASAVILGRSSNGRKEWTMIDGRTIAQMGH